MSYHSHIRKITKLGDGTYYSERYSVGFYSFLCFCKLMFNFFILLLKITILPINIPYMILKKLFNKK